MKHVDFPIGDSSLFHAETGITWRNGKGYEIVKKGEGSSREFLCRDTGTHTCLSTDSKYNATALTEAWPRVWTLVCLVPRRDKSDTWTYVDIAIRLLRLLLM